MPWPRGSLLSCHDRWFARQYHDRSSGPTAQNAPPRRAHALRPRVVAEHFSVALNRARPSMHARRRSPRWSAARPLLHASADRGARQFAPRRSRRNGGYCVAFSSAVAFCGPRHRATTDRRSMRNSEVRRSLSHSMELWRQLSRSTSTARLPAKVRFMQSPEWPPGRYAARSSHTGDPHGGELD